MSEVVERLKNDPEFLKKVEDMVPQNLTISLLTQLNERIRVFEEETKRMREESEKKEAHRKEIERIEARIEELREETNRTLVRYSMSLEEEAKVTLE